MFKILCIIVAIAVPILCASTAREGRKKYVFERIMEDYWKQRCKNVSGIEVDLERNERLYEEYTVCVTNAINTTQLRKDVQESLSSNFSNIATIAQRYCPNRQKYNDCEKTLSPIYNECYTLEENYSRFVISNVSMSMYDFFCENNADHIVQFVNANAIECGMKKQSELSTCMEHYIKAFFSTDDSNPLFGPIKPSATCNAWKTSGICFLSAFKQCETSTPAKLIKVLFKYLETNTECAIVNLRKQELTNRF